MRFGLRTIEGYFRAIQYFVMLGIIIFDRPFKSRYVYYANNCTLNKLLLHFWSDRPAILPLYYLTAILH